MTIANWSHDPVCLNIKVTAVETDGNYDIRGNLQNDDKESYSLPHEWKLPFKDRAQYLHITIGKAGRNHFFLLFPLLSAGSSIVSP